MSDTDAALSYLREQFGEGWTCAVAQYMTNWRAIAEHRGGAYATTTVAALGTDPMSAARACVEARDAAFPRLDLMGPPTPREMLEANKAERAHADRLAEALRDCEDAMQHPYCKETPEGHIAAEGIMRARLEARRLRLAHDARRKP